MQRTDNLRTVASRKIVQPPDSHHHVKNANIVSVRNRLRSNYVANNLDLIRRPLGSNDDIDFGQAKVLGENCFHIPRKLRWCLADRCHVLDQRY